MRDKAEHELEYGRAEVIVNGDVVTAKINVPDVYKLSLPFRTVTAFRQFMEARITQDLSDVARFPVRIRGLKESYNAQSCHTALYVTAERDQQAQPVVVEPERGRRIILPKPDKKD